MLHATIKSLADLPEHTVDLARRDSSASLTPRNDLSKLTQNRETPCSDTKVKCMHVHRRRDNPTGETLCLLHINVEEPNEHGTDYG